jgi:hypothetical protein
LQIAITISQFVIKASEIQIISKLVVGNGRFGRLTGVFRAENGKKSKDECKSKDATD